MSNDKPEYLVSPGEVVMDYIENWAKEKGIEFHWYDEYAEQEGIDEETMDRLCAGDQPITPAIAAKLEKLGRPAQYWLDLERQYQEDRARLSGISPWRKVADEEPPRDEQFLGRTVDPTGFVCYVGVVFWDRKRTDYREVWSGRILGINEWMPIPGGEE